MIDIYTRVIALRHRVHVFFLISLSIIIIIIIASHPCQGIGHRQTSSTHPCLELSCLEPTTLCQHLSFLFLHVSRGLPLPLEPCGFHWRACRVILFLPFLNVCPTHFHLRLPSSVCIGTCPVLSHSCSFLILSVHFSFKIFLKHLLTNTWSLFMTPCVVFQVSQPYSSTDNYPCQNINSFRRFILCSFINAKA